MNTNYKPKRTANSVRTTLYTHLTHSGLCIYYFFGVGFLLKSKLTHLAMTVSDYALSIHFVGMVYTVYTYLYDMYMIICRMHDRYCNYHVNYHRIVSWSTQQL